MCSMKKITKPFIPRAKEMISLLENGQFLENFDHGKVKETCEF